MNMEAEKVHYCPIGKVTAIKTVIAEEDQSLKLQTSDGENKHYFACPLDLVLSQIGFMHLVLLTVFSGCSVFCHPLDLLHFRLSQLLFGVC